MFRCGDKVRILKGMMIDIGERAEIVECVDVIYRIRILKRDGVYREVGEDEIEFVGCSCIYSWPPCLDDVE